MTWEPSDADDDPADHRRDGAFAVRLGLSSVRGIGTDLAQQIVEAREGGQPGTAAFARPDGDPGVPGRFASTAAFARHDGDPGVPGRFASMADVVRRAGLSTAQTEALATAGAFECFDLDRRRALWEAGPASQEHVSRLPGSGSPLEAPPLPPMTTGERSMSDLWATGITPDDHPMMHVRPALTERGVVTAAGLGRVPNRTRVHAAGVVTHRQRPATASGVTFMNLEDETGMVNVVVPVPVWNRYLRVARESSALIIRGVVEKNDGAINLVAEHFERLSISIASLAPSPSLPRMSRDFR